MFYHSKVVCYTFRPSYYFSSAAEIMKPYIMHFSTFRNMMAGHRREIGPRNLQNMKQESKLQIVTSR
jgi:hypothetical protein